MVLAVMPMGVLTSVLTPVRVVVLCRVRRRRFTPRRRSVDYIPAFFASVNSLSRVLQLVLILVTAC